MKTLFLVRHAKAETRSGDLPDFERPLSDRGRKDAALMARRCVKKGVNPSLIISSPAPRAYETARTLARSFGYRVKNIRTRKAIYDQSENALLDILHWVDDEYGSVMLVGHDPSMSEFAASLAGALSENLPTCGVLSLELEADTWSKVSAGSGKLQFLESPGEVRKIKEETGVSNPKAQTKELERKLIQRIEEVLDEVDSSVREKISGPVRKAGRELARTFIRGLKKAWKKP